MQQRCYFTNRRTIALVLSVVIVAAALLLLDPKVFNNSSMPEPASVQPNITVAAELAQNRQASLPSAQLKPNREQESDQASANPSRSQNGQLEIKQRPAWALASPLLQHVPALQQLADSGDVKAAYILAMNLRFCVAVPVTEDELQQRLQQAHLYQDDGAAVAELTERFGFCAGVDGPLRQQFYHYFERAALQGYVPAQEMVGLMTPEFYLKVTGAADLDRDAYIAKRDDFIQQKFAVLESASQQGSINALIQLSKLHYWQTYSQNYAQKYSQKNAQNPVENGRVHAYAINQMILEITQDNDLYNKYAWFQQRAQNELTEDEINRALEITNQWLVMIKANGTLYLPQPAE